MEIKFLGGASYVGCLGMLLKGEESMLFDYGILPVDPPKYPMEAPAVDSVFLTHCHIDHSGMMPWLASRYNCDIYATPPTMDVSELLLEDSIKVAGYEGHPQPFNLKEVRKTMRNFNTVDFGTQLEVGGYEVKVHSAGHIPGAAMYELNGHETALFTGDINNVATNLVFGANPVKCDNLIIESTYAGRNHPDRLKLEFKFVEKIKDVLAMGGKVILPSFAVGRTQELLLILRAQKFDITLDGMGAAVNKLYLKHPRFVRSAKGLRAAINKAKPVKRARDRKKVDSNVIVTTSGMLDGGPVLEYLQMFKDEPRNAVLLTGYQVEGTNGRKLMDTGMISMYGADVKVNAKLDFFDFSAHAGHDDLLRFIEGCNPEKVILMHGDNREELAKDIEGREVLLPMEGEWLEI